MLVPVCCLLELMGDIQESAQVLEWGGPPLSRNWHSAAKDNPTQAAMVLGDPGLLSRWRWTLARYPERMQALGKLEDEAFREALIDAMSRRLAIAKALVPVREIRARQSAGRADLAPLIEELERLRRQQPTLSARTFARPRSCTSWRTASITWIRGTARGSCSRRWRAPGWRSCCSVC